MRKETTTETPDKKERKQRTTNKKARFQGFIVGLIVGALVASIIWLFVGNHSTVERSAPTNAPTASAPTSSVSVEEDA